MLTCLHDYIYASGLPRFSKSGLTACLHALIHCVRFAKVKQGGFCDHEKGGALYQTTGQCSNVTKALCEQQCLSRASCTHISFGSHEGGEQCSCMLTAGMCHKIVPQGDATFAVFRRPLLVEKFQQSYCAENDILESTGSCSSISKGFCEEKCIRNRLCRYLSFGTAPGDAQCSCFLSSTKCDKRVKTADGWRYTIYERNGGGLAMPGSTSSSGASSGSSASSKSFLEHRLKTLTDTLQAVKKKAAAS